jgi:hypothetical protein
LDELPNFVSFVRYYDPSHHYGSLRSGKLLISTGAHPDFLPRGTRNDRVYGFQ